MNNNFLGIRGLYKTHMDGLKPFNSKSVTYTYIGYTEHNSRGQPIVWHAFGQYFWQGRGPVDVLDIRLLLIINCLLLYLELVV